MVTVTIKCQNATRDVTAKSILAATVDVITVMVTTMMVMVVAQNAVETQKEDSMLTQQKMIAQNATIITKAIGIIIPWLMIQLLGNVYAHNISAHQMEHLQAQELEMIIQTVWTTKPKLLLLTI